MKSKTDFNYIKDFYLIKMPELSTLPFQTTKEIIEQAEAPQLRHAYLILLEENAKLKKELKRANDALDLLDPMIIEIRRAALNWQRHSMTAQDVAQIALEATCPL